MVDSTDAAQLDRIDPLEAPWDDDSVAPSQSATSLAGQRVAFVGKLGAVTRREAHRLVAEQGGIAVDDASQLPDLVVLGAEELPLAEPHDLLDEPLWRAAAEGRLEIISETHFWQRMGLVDGEQNIRRLYTPAMLAALLKVPRSAIRRWHRRGLIVPVREVHRLPYFDFQEVATARRLAQLLAAGVSPASIERKLGQLARYLPDVERPLAQLSVIVDGRHLLLRRDEGLVEPGGQIRIDFDVIGDGDSVETAAMPDATRHVVPLNSRVYGPPPPDAGPDDLLRLAVELEDEGRLEAAADVFRAALAAGGPRADVCFQLAELLYRLGDVAAARERYYMAIELDEDFVEARFSLGCVLAETGQPDLAIAAFEGALHFHPDYADAHYHLALALDESGRTDAARRHWRKFEELAPDSLWADEARARLADETTEPVAPSHS